EGRRGAAELMSARLEAKIVGEKLAAAINTVYANGSNFEIDVDLPQKIGSHFYKIEFDNTARQVVVENSAWGTVGVGVVCKNDDETMRRSVTANNASIEKNPRSRSPIVSPPLKSPSAA
ncbi:unnamed protein product, partial [marine sediment metagenome]